MKKWLFHTDLEKSNSYSRNGIFRAIQNNNSSNRRIFCSNNWTIDLDYRSEKNHRDSRIFKRMVSIDDDGSDL